MGKEKEKACRRVRNDFAVLDNKFRDQQQWRNYATDDKAYTLLPNDLMGVYQLYNKNYGGVKTMDALKSIAVMLLIIVHTKHQHG